MTTYGSGLYRHRISGSLAQGHPGLSNEHTRRHANCSHVMRASGPRKPNVVQELWDVLRMAAPKALQWYRHDI